MSSLVPSAGPDRPSDVDRAKVELATRLISLARLCEHLAQAVLDHQPPLSAVESVRAVRRAVNLAQACVTWSVRLTMARGASWREVGEGLSRDEAFALSEHGPGYEAWSGGRAVSDFPGLPPTMGMPADRWPTSYLGRVRAIARWRRERRAAQVPQ